MNPVKKQTRLCKTIQFPRSEYRIKFIIRNILFLLNYNYNTTTDLSTIITSLHNPRSKLIELRRSNIVRENINTKITAISMQPRFIAL